MNEETTNEKYKYELDIWESGTLVAPAKVTIDNVDYPVTPAVYTGNTPITPDRLEVMNQGIKNLYEEGAISKDIYIGPIENAPEEAKLIIDPEEVKVKPNGVINSMEGNETDKSPSVHAVKEALKMIKGEIVWANPNPTQPTGKLTPDIDITEYDSYAVLCYGNTSKNALLNTGLIFKNNNTRLFYIDAGYPLYRVITCQNNLVNFESAARIKTLGNAELVDTVIIPAFVIGYKTQLLDSEVNG